jgi:hypothetical protein
MLRHWSKVQLLASLIALGFLALGAAKAAGDPKLNAQLEETITKVRTEKSLMARIDQAEHLAELTHGVNPKSVDDQTVGDMVSLLDDPDDAVRLWVAGALGHLGRRAKVAAPKLLALLPEADCLQGDLTSAAAIRPALKRMGVKPPPPPSPQECAKR